MPRNALLCLLTVLLAISVTPSPASAQFFGKNQVRWEDTDWKYYENTLEDGSPGHFAFYIGLDLDEAAVLTEIRSTAHTLESAYANRSAWLEHTISKRIIVVISRTHKNFEGLSLSGSAFMPEGVGAYATTRSSRLLPNTDLVLVIKPDFLPTLNGTIARHEMGHIFQFDLVGWQFFVDTSWRIPGWLFEGSAEYMAGLDAPYTRDDIRRRRQRIAAANAKDTSKFPTLLSLNYGMADPYAFGEMVFEFLEARYGKEQTLKFIRTIFKDHKEVRLMSALEDISGGAFRNPEDFDRAHRDYWSSLFVSDALSHAKPYESTANYEGRQILQRPWPHRLTTPRITPDNASVVCMTVDPKYGLVLATVPALTRDEAPYIADPDHRYRERVRRRKYRPVQVLTKFMPPRHYEYLIAQEQIVWPFNGFDLDIWQEPAWAVQARDAYANVQSERRALAAARASHPRKSEKKKDGARYRTKVRESRRAIAAAEKRLDAAVKAYAALQRVSGVNLAAFFARVNEDHGLYIFDINLRKIVSVVKVATLGAQPLDQAFSPSFSPDGSVVYFSAARHVRRDIYSVRTDGSTEPVRITTEGVFNSAPAVSPDGTKLAYVSFVGEFQKLFLRDLTTGTTQQLTQGSWNDNSPSWSSDSTTLAFTSDEVERVWNLYTVELSTRTVRRWTDFYGGAYTPSFATGENDRIILASFIEDDQNDNRTDPNFELFDLRLKRPLSTSVIPPAADVRAVQTPEQPPGPELDAQQIINAQVPARWKFYDGDLVLYGNSRGGFAGYADIKAQNIMGNRTHQFVAAGSRYLKMAKYQYLDETGRWTWTAGASFTEYPLVFRLSGLWGQFPSYPEPYGDRYQSLLNWTRFREQEASVALRYPFTKWSRIEVGARARRRDYRFTVTLPEETPDGVQGVPIETDRQFRNYFGIVDDAVHASINAGFVHDTVLYSQGAMGPLNGTAFRGQVEVGYPLNGAARSFYKYSASFRQYISLTPNTVFAFRVDGLYTTRPNGDVMFLGGNDTLRNYPYYSVACDRCAVTSTEFRFPLGEAYLLKAFPLRLRGIIFGDLVNFRFSDRETLGSVYRGPEQEWAVGFGAQVWMGPLPINFNWARTRFSPDKFDFNVWVGYNF